MTLAKVLKEQRRVRIPPAGLHVLQAIEKETQKIHTTVSNFQQSNRVMKPIQASSTVVRCRLCWLYRGSPSTCTCFTSVIATHFNKLTFRPPRVCMHLLALTRADPGCAWRGV